MHFPPTPINISTSSALFSFFPKNSWDSVAFFGCGWALKSSFCRRYFLLLCFRVPEPISPCPQGHWTERCRTGEWGRAIYTSGWAAVSSPWRRRIISVSKTFPKGRNPVFVLLAIGKKTVLVYKPCLTQRPFFPQKTPSSMWCFWPRSKSLLTHSSENVDPLHCLLMGCCVTWHSRF